MIRRHFCRAPCRPSLPGRSNIQHLPVFAGLISRPCSPSGQGRICSRHEWCQQVAVTTSVLLSNRFMAQDIENGHDIRVPTGRTAPKSVTRQPLQTVFNLCLIAICANHSYRNYLNSWHSATQLEPTKLALDSSSPMVPMRQRYLGCSHCIRHQNKTPIFSQSALAWFWIDLALLSSALLSYGRVPTMPLVT